jgi:DNA-binding beta-propeller fold protein YncE
MFLRHSVTCHVLVAASLATMSVASADAQSSATMAPTNDHPNPYETVVGWAKLPEGRTWGSTSAVEIDKDGVSIWVAERCQQNSCTGSNLPAILKFDANGNLVKSFGAGILNFPHGIHVDRDGNVWVTDGQDNRPRGRRGEPPPATPDGFVVNGHQIFKFSPDGQLLMTLGNKGGGRDSLNPSVFFWQPNDVLVAPDGSIFVAEGHSSAPNSVARVLKLDRTGKLIKTIGKFGTGPEDMDQPHALAMDSRGRLFVGDRSNNRILIMDQEGKLLDTWYQFSRPSGIYIDAQDRIYVADSESGSVGNGRSRTWKRGIRIGSAKDGSIVAFIPDPATSPPSTSSAEGVAADRNGVIYGAEVGERALKRYVIKK